MPPRRHRLRGAGSSLAAADRVAGEVPAGAAVTAGPAGDAPAPPAPPAPAQPRLLQLPDDLILEVGLRLDHLGDLHTLLRRTCKRLRAITMAPCSGVGGAGGGCRGGSDAGSGGGYGGGRQPGGTQEQQHLGGQGSVSAPWPSAAGRVQAAWLIKWRGGTEPEHLVNAPADRGDGDVTLSLLEHLAATPGRDVWLAVAACKALAAAARHSPSPQHERIIDAVFRSHGAAVAALEPLEQTCLLHQGCFYGSLALVGAMLGLGAGTVPIDPVYRDAMENIRMEEEAASDELVTDEMRLGFSELTPCDIALLGAARSYYGGVLMLLLEAQQEGRAALTPFSVVMAWGTVAEAVLDHATEPQRGSQLAAPLVRLTGMLRGSVRETVSNGFFPSAMLVELLADRLPRVAASGSVELLEGLLGALPPLPLECRAFAAMEAAHHGRTEAVSVLLGAPPPHDPSSPWDANGAAPAVLPPTSLGDVLRAAAVRGFTEAALAVLDTAVGGAEEVCALVGSSGALEGAAQAGHASTVRALVARAGAGLRHEPLQDAAEAAREAGHTQLAGTLDRAAASAHGRQEAAGR